MATTNPNTTQITPPRVAFIDERTKTISREWYRWLYSLYDIVGAGVGIIPVTSGGTGLATIPTNGQLLIGNGTGYSLNTLGVGVGITVTNGIGTISVANAGVLSNIAGTGISVSSATGNVTVANTGVLSFSGGTTGLTPATATAGVVNLAGTLAIANGGTGQTSYTNGQLLIGNTTGNTLTKSTLTAGTGISITNGTGSISIAATNTGTVTSVAATVPAFLSVSGSPITTSGTLAITLSGTALPIANGGTGATTLAGASIATYAGTETLTNKRIDPRVISAASASTLTPSIATADIYAYTALAAGLTINAPTGTPVDGDKLMFRLLDNGTSRALTWDATYTVIGVTLPTATTISKTTYVGCIYNANNTRWDVIAVTTQA
jgi:hypothetical protein